MLLCVSFMAHDSYATEETITTHSPPATKNLVLFKISTPEIIFYVNYLSDFLTMLLFQNQLK